MRILLLCAVSCFVPSVCYAEQSIPRIEALVDLSAADGGRAALESLASKLGGNEPVIFLDLKLISPPSDDLTDAQLAAAGPPKLPIIFRPRAGKMAQLVCDNNFDQAGELTLQTSNVYPHLLLSLMTENPRENPFQSVSCGYDSANPVSPAFYVRGYYTRRYEEVATAVAVTMWPVRPY